MTFSYLSVFKYSTAAVVSVGVGKIVSGVVQSNVAPAGLVGNICVKAAQFALTMLISSMAEKHVNEFIDSVVDGVEKQRDN